VAFLLSCGVKNKTVSDKISSMFDEAIKESENSKNWKR
jgi:hypothetical protein